MPNLYLNSEVSKTEYFISQAKNELLSPQAYHTVARGHFQETVAKV
jgi:hypothetical protein